MTYQNEKRDCGKAVVRNALTYIFKDENYQWLYSKEEDADFLSIRNHLNREGVNYNGFECEAKDLYGLKKSQFPLIVQVRNGSANHFVLILSIGKKKVKVSDPQFGLYYLTKAEFEDVFLGKVLVKDSIQAKPKKVRMEVLLVSERLSYVFLFVMQAFSFSFLLYSVSVQDNPSSFLFLILSSLSLFLHVLSNRIFLQRLQKRILYPYLDLYRNGEDFPHLFRFLQETVSRYSLLVSSSLCVFELLVVYISNGVFASLLGAISCLFGVLLYLFGIRYNEVNRFCSLEEEKMTASLLVNQKEIKVLKPDYRKHLSLAQKKAEEFHVKLVLIYLFLAVLLTLFIFIDMKLQKKESLNYFLFYLTSGFTICHFTKKSLKTYFDDRKRIQSLNSLSQDLSLFLMKNKTSLRYTNKRFGGFAYGRKKGSHSGLSG